ncbi:MAG: pyrimidine dimer DNA glycosylase/endonuclease V [Bowdeniella nasicola]|nr:pyrimidine dimer DNA glycosylase/endonuclease V [Bowdeniella nasicola]
MRLWSVHPAVLDRRALVACWRESLLAQAVLRGATRGYRNHPQLERWRAHHQPLAVLGGYLTCLWWEARERGYNFNAAKIASPPMDLNAVRATSELPVGLRLAVTDAQLAYELVHLRAKVAARAAEELWRLPAAGEPIPAAAIFDVVPGPVASWEVGARTSL